MKNILTILSFILCFNGFSQSLYIPSNPDSIKVPVNVNGAVRTVYNIDLVKYRAALTARDTAAALRLLISGNTTAIATKQKSLGWFDVTTYGAVADGVTDNTTAYTSCLSAIVASGGGIMYFPAGGIWIGKIIIPAVNSTTFVPIEVRGAMPPAFTFGTIGNYPLATVHTIIKSTSTTGSVISAAQNTGTGNFQNFSNITLSIRDLEVRSYDNPTINGVDAQYAQQLKLENVFINTGVYGVQAANPTNGKAGLITPNINNGAITVIINTVISGFYNGVIVNEHTSAQDLVVAECFNGLNIKAAYQPSNFVRLGLYRNTQNIYVAGVHRFAINQLNIEHANSATQTNAGNIWQVTAFDIKDTANLGVADISYAVIKGDIGIDHTFTTSGGTGILSHEIGVSTNYLTKDAFNNLSYTSSSNASQGIKMSNSTNGTGAIAVFQAVNSAGTAITMGMTAPTFSTSGIISGSNGYVYSTGKMGISSNSQPITFSSDNLATSALTIAANGSIIFPSTNTAAGTTGAQTINKVTGSVNFAAGATTLVVTNSLVSATSYVQVQVYGSDATAKTATVTRAAGSFTITLNAAATNEVAVGFIVHN